MKKSIICIFMFLFLISIVSAYYTEPILFLDKTQYQPGETLFMTLEGNFAQNLTSSNFKFSDSKREISLEYDYVLYDGVYFFFAYFPNEGNFTIKIQNILYKDPSLKSKTLIANISVKKKENSTQILSIKPGFIYSEDSAKISLSNKGSGPLEVSYGSEKFSLAPSESRDIFPELKSGLSFLELQSYETFKVPLISPSSETPSSNQTNPPDPTLTTSPPNQTSEEKPLLMFSKEKLILNSTQDKAKIEEIKLFNYGKDINSIKISSVNPVLVVSPYDSGLKQNSSQIINLTFYSKEPGFFSGNISILYSFKGKDFQKLIPFEFYSLSLSPIKSDTKKNCQQLNGKICINQKCNGNYTFTSAGEYCCIGTCEEIQEETSNTMRWIMGFVLLIILGFLGFLAWKKYKKVKPESSEKVLEKKNALFENRIRGGLARS